MIIDEGNDVTTLTLPMIGAYYEIYFLFKEIIII